MGAPGAASATRRIAGAIEACSPAIPARSWRRYRFHRDALRGFAWVARCCWDQRRRLRDARVLLLDRVAVYPRRVLEDLCDHGRGAGFFTTVAATCVLVDAESHRCRQHAVARCYFSWHRLWFVVMYGFFTAVVIREEKPTLEAGINGLLMAIVATQAVFCSRFAATRPRSRRPESRCSSRFACTCSARCST